MNTPALNDNEIQQVLRILRTNGQGPNVIRGIAEQYNITESLVRDLGQVITESASALTETTIPSATASENRQRYLAEQLAEQVNAAESKPLSEASISDLNAIAAARFGG